jgi:hypothetical protein
MDHVLLQEVLLKFVRQETLYLKLPYTFLFFSGIAEILDLLYL